MQTAEEKLNKTDAKLETTPRKLLAWHEQQMGMSDLSAWNGTKPLRLHLHNHTMTQNVKDDSIWNGTFMGHMLAKQTTHTLFHKEDWFHFSGYVKCENKGYEENPTVIHNAPLEWCVAEVSHPMRTWQLWKPGIHGWSRLKWISSSYSTGRNPRIVMGAMQMGGTQSLVTVDNICYHMWKEKVKVSL